jgi:hypothetical protein
MVDRPLVGRLRKVEVIGATSLDVVFIDFFYFYLFPFGKLERKLKTPYKSTAVPRPYHSRTV